MKKNIIGRWVAGFAVAIAIFASCTQEMSEVRLDPALGTTQSQTITSDSATVVGYVVAQGDGFTEKGICYATTPNPTIDNNKKEYTGAMNTATFAVRLGGLAYATKYYARAYAIGNNTVIYGPELTFTTKPVVPMLTTAAITDITGKQLKAVAPLLWQVVPMLPNVVLFGEQVKTRLFRTAKPAMEKDWERLPATLPLFVAIPNTMSVLMLPTVQV